MVTTKRTRRISPEAESPRSTPQAMLARIRSLLLTMGAASQRIGEFVINYPAEVVHMSVSEVAERTQCSEGSVVGFCKLLGATGFQQLKISLAQQIVQPVQ
ncbi:MurR/RpiR family transcriptional regulator [Alcaligenes aquatilis]|uniref:MurR/RpiR family transcriptional regulator n=1 Tax=Alcaligenes aquatilis TaxID=323284 RepID=UPI003F8EECB2